MRLAACMPSIPGLLTQAPCCCSCGPDPPRCLPSVPLASPHTPHRPSSLRGGPCATWTWCWCCISVAVRPPIGQPGACPFAPFSACAFVRNFRSPTSSPSSLSAQPGAIPTPPTTPSPTLGQFHSTVLSSLHRTSFGHEARPSLPLPQLPSQTSCPALFRLPALSSVITPHTILIMPCCCCTRPSPGLHPA